MSSLDDAGDALAAACRPLFDDPDCSWCRDFLLGASAPSDVAILTDTRPLAHATIISVAMAGIEETGILRGAADGAVAIDFYLVPVISVGNRSVGMAVQRYSREATVEYGTGRYAIHNQTGELLILWTESLLKENMRASASSSVATFAAVATLINGRPPQLPVAPPARDDQDTADDTDVGGNMSSSGSRASYARGNGAGGRTIRIQWLAPRRGGPPEQPLPRGTLAREMEDLAALCDAALFEAGRYKDSILVSHRTPDFNRHACEACMDANAGPAGNVEQLSELFASACFCSAPLRTPDQTGFDWASQIGNVKAYGGLYRGLTEVNLCLPGAVPSSVSFRKLTSSQLRVCREYVVSESIRQVALQARMQQSNPWGQVMPASYLQMQVDSTTAGPFGVGESHASGARLKQSPRYDNVAGENEYVGRTQSHRIRDARAQQTQVRRWDERYVDSERALPLHESVEQPFGETRPEELAGTSTRSRIVKSTGWSHLEAETVQGRQAGTVQGRHWHASAEEPQNEIERPPARVHGNDVDPVAEGQTSLRLRAGTTVEETAENAVTWPQPGAFQQSTSRDRPDAPESERTPQPAQHQQRGRQWRQADPNPRGGALVDADLGSAAPAQSSVFYFSGEPGRDVGCIPSGNRTHAESSSFGESLGPPLAGPSLTLEARPHPASYGVLAGTNDAQESAECNPAPVPLQVTPSADDAEHSNPSARGAVSIAPRPGQVKPGIVIDEAREKRLRERKQRNREAAARSNAQRREKNEALKEALRVAHEQAKELAKKKEDLGRENETLRAQLASTKTREEQSEDGATKQ